MQRACGKYLHGEEGDLSAKLEEALTSGWSIETLKAYAFSIWQQSASDDITEAAWRLAVEFTDSDGCSGGRNFLNRFSVDPGALFGSIDSPAQRSDVRAQRNSVPVSSQQSFTGSADNKPVRTKGHEGTRHGQYLVSVSAVDGVRPRCRAGFALDHL